MNLEQITALNMIFIVSVFSILITPTLCWALTFKTNKM